MDFGSTGAIQYACNYTEDEDAEVDEEVEVDEMDQPCFVAIMGNVNCLGAETAHHDDVMRGCGCASSGKALLG
jgi:hypothetical protein